jgi:hypothetical protein
MKKLLLFLLTLFSMVPALAQTSFEKDGVWYSVNSEPWEESPGVKHPGEVSVIKSSDASGYVGNIIIPAQVVYTNT